jgi:hypothetical protein
MIVIYRANRNRAYACSAFLAHYHGVADLELTDCLWLVPGTVRLID